MTSKKVNSIIETEFYKGFKIFAEGIYLIGQEIGKVIIPVAEAIQNVLNNIDPEKLKIFLEKIDKFQKNEPYLTELLNQLKNNDNLSHANEALSLACFIQLIYENEDKPEDVNIFDVINSDYFKKMFFSAASHVELGENFTKREAVLKEAFELYKLEYYAGCLTLLYGQLEGILTDYLVYKKAILKFDTSYKYCGEKINYMNEKNEEQTIKKNKNITGIYDKIIIAKNINQYFDKLDAYRLDSEYKINNDRNDILHGNILDRFTRERCFIVIIWLMSILKFLYFEKNIKL